MSIPAPAQGYELDQSFCARTQLNNQVLEQTVVNGNEGDWTFFTAKVSARVTHRESETTFPPKRHFKGKLGNAIGGCYYIKTMVSYLRG